MFASARKRDGRWESDARFNFAYYLDPNGDKNTPEYWNATNKNYWPQYGQEGNMFYLAYDRVANDTITDDYRKEGFDYLLSRPKLFNYRRDGEGL